MNWMDILKLIAAVASGLVIIIPLVIQIAKRGDQVVKEKNWPVVLAKVIELMETAEKMFEVGADRKAWVMEALRLCADSIDYDIDYDVISDMIDRLCTMSKVINAKINDNKNTAD